jgi:hypothetical protein
MVDRYAKFATEHLAVAAARIEGKRGENPTYGLVGRAGVEPATNGLKGKSQRSSNAHVSAIAEHLEYGLSFFA